MYSCIISLYCVKYYEIFRVPQFIFKGPKLSGGAAIE